MTKKAGAAAAATLDKDLRLDLDQFAPFLMNHVGGRWVTLFADQLRDSPVGYTEWRVLGALSFYGTMELTDVATIANFDLSTLSRVVARLEGQGLIRRLQAERRGRAVPIALSPEGAAFMGKFQPLALECEKAFLSTLTPAEQVALISVLRKLFDHLNPARPAPAP